MDSEATVRLTSTRGCNLSQMVLEIGCAADLLTALIVETYSEVRRKNRVAAGLIAKCKAAHGMYF
jgi:hypothetical protein